VQRQKAQKGMNLQLQKIGFSRPFRYDVGTIPDIEDGRDIEDSHDIGNGL
jgi:hypothetical protein